MPVLKPFFYGSQDMDRSGADAYVYARACGLYARSYVGIRAKKLFAVKRLQELWSLLYPEEVPLVPEGLLALYIEQKSEKRIVGEFIRLISSYDTPDSVSTSLLSLYEYNNLKAAAAALALGKTERPFMVDIGPFSFVEWDSWPDIAAMTRNTVVSWFNRVPNADEQVLWETRLDHQYYRTLWTSVKSLGKKDRESAEALIREEIVLQNIIWALRLRVYYGMTGADILPLLAGYTGSGAEMEGLYAPAVAILHRPVDVWGEWAGWKYAWLLNPHEEGVPWTVDPRWAQLAADRYLYRLAMAQFHQMPFTAGMLVSFFKIKQLEVQMIRVASEGLRLGASESQMSDFMGESQDV